MLKSRDKPRDPYKRNIILLSIINFCTDFRLYAIVMIIYFAEVAGSYALGMLVFTVAGITTTLFEIPTGILSDRFGRKATLILDGISNTLSVVFFAFAGDIRLLLVGGFFDGLARALNSGNTTALLYESLNQSGRKADFHHIMGKVSSFFQIALGISALIGSVIAARDMRLVFFISAGFQSAVILLGIFITEPPVEDSEKSRRGKLLNALKPFWHNKELRRISMANVLSYAIGESTYQFQTVFIKSILPFWGLGLSRSLSNLGAAVGFWFSGKIIQRMGDIPTMLISSIIGRIVSFAALLFPGPHSPYLLASTSLFYGSKQTASQSF